MIAKENLTLLCIVCLVGCGIISGFSIIFREPLLNILGASEFLMDYCMDYALPLFCVAPLALLGMALQSFFIANGTPGLGMGFSVAGGVVNIWTIVNRIDTKECNVFWERCKLKQKALLADFIFMLACVIKIIPIIWMFIWAGIIAIINIISGFVVEKRFVTVQQLFVPQLLLRQG